MHYEPTWGVLGKLMDVTMMRSQLRKLFDRVLAGLETHLNTGAVVGRDGKPEQPAAPASVAA